MSYDIQFYVPREGSTVVDAHQEMLDGVAEGASPVHRVELTRERQRGLVELITQACPDLELEPCAEITQLCTPEGVESPFSWCVGVEGVSLSWPYAKSGENLRRVIERVRPAVEALYAQGLRAYDPQLDRAFDPEQDWVHVEEVYGGANQRIADTLRVSAGHSTPRPWWKFW